MRRKKTKKQRLLAEADRALQIFVMKDRPRCLVCGRPAYCGHHFINKASSNALRYYLPNMIPICIKHHLLVHSQPSLVDPVISFKKGEAWFKDLMREKRKTVRTNNQFYSDAIEKYKEKM